MIRTIRSRQLVERLLGGVAGLHRRGVGGRGLGPGLLGLLELLVGLLGRRLELGEPAAELVDLRLELEAAGLELLDRLARLGRAPTRSRRPSPAPRPAPPRPPRACALPRRRRRRYDVQLGRARAPRPRSGWPRSPSASGTATAAATSTASTPVDDSAAVSSPLRTARAHSGSSIAAVSVASTWSATAWVTLTPSSFGQRPGLLGHRRGQLPPLLGQRPQLRAVHPLLGLAQRRARRRSPAPPARPRGVRTG